MDNLILNNSAVEAKLSKYKTKRCDVHTVPSNRVNIKLQLIFVRSGYSSFPLSAVKPKPKLLLWPITKDAEQSIVQTKLEAITRSAGKLVRASHDWFWFYF